MEEECEDQYTLCCDRPIAYCARCSIQYVTCPTCTHNNVLDVLCWDYENMTGRVVFCQFAALVAEGTYGTVKRNKTEMERYLYVNRTNKLRTGYRCDEIQFANKQLQKLYDTSPITGDCGGEPVIWYCYECGKEYETTDK